MEQAVSFQTWMNPNWWIWSLDVRHVDSLPCSEESCCFYDHLSCNHMVWTSIDRHLNKIIGAWRQYNGYHKMHQMWPFVGCRMWLNVAIHRVEKILIFKQEDQWSHLRNNCLNIYDAKHYIYFNSIILENGQSNHWCNSLEEILLNCLIPYFFYYQGSKFSRNM